MFYIKLLLFCGVLIGVWLRRGSSVKPSTQIVTSYDECQKRAADRQALVHCAAKPRFVLLRYPGLAPGLACIH